MLIDLKKIKVYCLTVPWMDKRIESIENTFGNLGIPIEFIIGEKTTPYAKGLAQGHINALQKSGSEPCLIVEDDVVLNPSYNGSLEFRYLPEWADALYIGTSVFGRIKGNTVYHGLLATDYGSYLRVFNKLSMHAVIHISNSYKQGCISNFNHYINNPIGGCDDIIADQMKFRNVFSLKVPMFVQSDGHNDEATKLLPQAVI